MQGKEALKIKLKGALAGSLSVILFEPPSIAIYQESKQPEIFETEKGE